MEESSGEQVTKTSHHIGLIKLWVHPSQLEPLVEMDQKANEIGLVNLAVDKEASNGLFDVDVTFKPVRISRGLTHTKDYFIGSSGALISLFVEKGSLLWYTSSEELTTSYERTFSKKRNCGFSLSPAVRGSDGVDSAIHYSRNQSIEHRISFDFSEEVLSAMPQSSGIEWDFSQPRGEKAIRDFLSGRLYLGAMFHWPNRSLSGNLVLRLSDVSFFNAERYRIKNPYKALSMQWAMWVHGRKLPSQTPVDIKFRVEADEDS